MRPVQGEGKTALQGFNREEILGWCTVKETQGHRDSSHCTRTSSPKKEGQYLKKTTYISDIQVMVHTVKNHCKSVPAQLHHQVRSSAPRIIDSSSISTLFQYRWHKTGFITTSPVQPPIAAFPLLNHVWQFVAQGRSKFLIQNCPFLAFIKLLQVQIPIFRHTFCFQIQHLISL